MAASFTGEENLNARNFHRLVRKNALGQFRDQIWRHSDGGFTVGEREFISGLKKVFGREKDFSASTDLREGKGRQICHVIYEESKKNPGSPPGPDVAFKIFPFKNGENSYMFPAWRKLQFEAFL